MKRAANPAFLNGELAPRYLLSEHVHLCVSGEQLVMLDLARNDYLALPEPQARLLSGVVAGWPLSGQVATDCPDEQSRSNAVALARSMSARGLLTQDTRYGKAATQPDISSASGSLRDDEAGVSGTIRARHVAAFGSAAVSAAFKLRWVPIGRVVRGVARRRAARVSRIGYRDAREAATLVDIFYRLRPFFFTAANACLFDSLTLIQFLARFGHSPAWVFGVQTAPFGAHCWVQQGCTVLNDTVEHVQRYTPIMAV